MAMSSDERRKRIHRAAMAQKRGEAAGASRDQARRAAERRRRASRRRRQNKIRVLAAVLLGIAAVLLSVFAVRSVYRFFKNSGQPAMSTPPEDGADLLPGSTDETSEAAEKVTVSEEETRLTKAARLASMYDYDGAISLLTEDEEIAADAEAQAAVQEYEAVKATLVRQDPMSVTHVFFHILVVDPENAFNKSKWGKQADGYNSLMTTIREFRKMLDELYADGFVLVRLHDLASMQQTEDGNMKMTQGNIMLPPGKKAMVMSQDDVCYYEYMEGAGYAERMIIGEDGRPTCVYVDENGQEQVGEYDLVPILDKFIDEHPDFSYKGAKACLAFTGYNGILGYRTDETYDRSSDLYDPEKTANPNIAEDRETAKEVAAALKADGYELASHSWGHRDLGQISLEHLKKDTDRWDKNVNQALLNGACDIILYPKGADVADWHPYSHDNEKFDYLWNKGFRYFCNVDASQAWVQIGSDYLRQGRRPLDGLALWNDIANGKNRLSDLFADVSAIFDPDRPTPVPDY